MQSLNMHFNTMGYSKQERTFLVEQFYKTKSILKCLEAFRCKYRNKKVPNRATIYRIINRFRANGTVEDQKRRRVSTVLTENKLLEVHELLLYSPRKSLRKLKQQSDISYGSAQRATRQLKLHPYRVQVVHELKETDRISRMNYCNWLLQFVRNGKKSMDNLYFSDEAWFHLDGYVNSQNSRIWSTDNPHAIYEKPLYAQKIGVWCAISRIKIIGPIFFTDTVTSDVYRAIIQQFIALLEPSDRYCWFQQDGATAHTATATMSELKEFFDDRIVSRGLWPPRSPDLTPPDYFLWGHLKNKVYANRPRTIEELKSNISACIALIDSRTCRRVARNAVMRARRCLNENGGHFQQLL
jgi:hypothetical protein